MGTGNKFDKMLAAAAEEAERLPAWKIAFLQQVENQNQSPDYPSATKGLKTQPKQDSKPKSPK